MSVSVHFLENGSRCVHALHRARARAVDALRQQQAMATCARLARRITPALLQSLRIPHHEATLVAALASLHCRSNREAVYQWVLTQLTDVDAGDSDSAYGIAGAWTTERTAELVQILAARLQHQLFEFEDTYP